MSLVWIQIPHSTKFKIYIFFSNVLIEIRNHTNQNPFSLFLLLLLYLQNHLPSLFQNPKTLTLTHTNTHRLSDRLVKQAISPMTAVPAPTPGRELSNPPADGISNLRFSNHSDHLLVSSWDKVLLLSLSLSLSLTNISYGSDWAERSTLRRERQRAPRRVHARRSRTRLLLPRRFLWFQCRRR